MKPLILGEAPSRTGDTYWQFPLSGRPAERLCTWAGIRPQAEGSRYGRFYWALREAFDLENVIERWPGSEGKGAAFPRDLALAGVARLRADLDEHRTFVLLGRRVERLLMAQAAPFFSWRQSSWGSWVVTLPHPSGLTREYNSLEGRSSAGRALRQAMGRHGMATGGKEW